jgi:hypothetical protein
VPRRSHLRRRYCRHYISGELGDCGDEDRLIKLHRTLQSNRNPNGSVVRDDRRAVAAIAKRHAHKARKKNPELSGMATESQFSM